MLLSKPLATSAAALLALLLPYSTMAQELPPIINPTGNCTAEDDGGRLGYHTPLPEYTYLPDCQNPLKRELWRVFQDQFQTAAIVPRPDGLGITYGLCGDDSAAPAELADVAQRYQLCDETVTDPSVMNAMFPPHALMLANAFHRQLRFTVETTGDSASIVPFAPHTDILDACETLDTDATEALAYCESVSNLCDETTGECIEMAVELSVEAAQQLVPALNELYGVLEEGQQCETEASVFGCPVAGCAAPPEGCTYEFGNYAINGVGDCCERQCYAVDGDGNECGSNNPQVGEQCDPAAWGTDVDRMCPVAGCTEAPDGCDYVFDHYVVDSEENCCPALCYAVDVDGNECSHDDAADPQPETIGETCDPSAWGTDPNQCPMAKCAAPPSGCDYVFDHHVVTQDGNKCCPSLCYAVDGDGNECTRDDNDAAAPQPEKIGETCDPASWGTDPDECPVARCAAPPDGCDYVFDHYVVTEDDKCCPSLCYAVDSDGNQCTFEQAEDNVQVGALCDPVEVGTEEVKCPVAGCAEAPSGCAYVPDHYVFNVEGDCCASLCYAVDGGGNECSHSGGASARLLLWLSFVWMGLVFLVLN